MLHVSKKIYPLHVLCSDLDNKIEEPHIINQQFSVKIKDTTQKMALWGVTTNIT